MTADQLFNWLRSLQTVAEPSVDRVIVGAPDTVVAGIGVVWMPTLPVLRKAAAQGLNVIVAHEPTFYSHFDLNGADEATASAPPRAHAAIEATRHAKRNWIEKHGLVVIRCHDVLDTMRGGVVDSLAAGLGFSEWDYVAVSGGYRSVRLKQAVAAGGLARRLAGAFAELGQPGVAFYGDETREIRTLGLGTGYGCELWKFVELGVDMAVTVDDRIKTWIEPVWCADSGFPIAVIHHGTSEEWGVRHLSRLISAAFPEVRVRHLPQGCTARWFPAEQPSQLHEYG